LTTGFGFAGASKISPDLLQADPDSTVDIIVQFTGVPTETDHQRIREHGAELKKELPVVKGALYSVPARKLEGLSKNPRVVYISPDRPVSASLDLSAAAVNASVAWQWGFVGKGIGVAVIDSGISNHDDLKTVICLNPPSCTSYTPSSTPRVVYSQDFMGGDTLDHYGHGEHVAGIVAGDGIDSSCSTCTRAFRGIAPYANLVNLRVLDQNGQGTDSAVISALQQAVNLNMKYRIGVINLSLGRPVFESYKLDPLCQAVEAAWKAGIVVVVAAGNYGRNNSMGTSDYRPRKRPLRDHRRRDENDGDPG
jgi:serine protease AprX